MWGVAIVLKLTGATVEKNSRWLRMLYTARDECQVIRTEQNDVTHPIT
jgi:hypothetical protein